MVKVNKFFLNVATSNIHLQEKLKKLALKEIQKNFIFEMEGVKDFNMIEIDGVKIEQEHLPYVIAELSANHDGSID